MEIPLKSLYFANDPTMPRVLLNGRVAAAGGLGVGGGT